MNQPPTPGDDGPPAPDGHGPVWSAVPDEHHSLTARISAVQHEERRRRRLRAAWIGVAVGGVAIGLGTILAFVAFGTSARGTDHTRTPDEPRRSPTTERSEVPPTSEDRDQASGPGSTQQGTTTTGTAPPGTRAPAPAPPVECDTAAITAALLNAPEPYEIDGTPRCSEAFWVVPVVVPSDNQKLVVVFEVGSGGPEAIAVNRREQCPSVAGDEPTFDPGLCPS